MRYIRFASSILAIWAFSVGLACAAVLSVQVDTGTRHYTSEQLLGRSDAREITVARDVSYHRPMTFQAVPLASLLEGVSGADFVQFVALDGFVAEIGAALLLNVDDTRARAWLAIENPAQPWPALPGGKPGAGPFYLIWTQPRASGIVPEQWPYQIEAIRRQASVAERFPAMLPAGQALAEGGAIARGWNVFRTHCMVCHTMNRAGDARVGPDLNVPYSPVEYLKAGFLRQYIRNPQALRHWPQTTMPAFTADVLPDTDLDALLGYLEHMATRKTADGQALSPVTP